MFTDTNKKEFSIYSNEFDTWTLGANWILTPYVRLIANYVHTSFDMPVTTKAIRHEDAITVRAQMDF